MKTYEEWSKNGFAVIKGEKALGRDMFGKAVFSEDQVTEKRTKMSLEEAELYGYDTQHY